MEESLTGDAPAEPEAKAKEPSRFGEGPTAFLNLNISTRMSVILMCMMATGTQLILRSVPFTATVGPDSMSAAPPTGYDWDEHEAGMVYASFGWGYCLSQIPGGMLSVKYGAKSTFLFFLSAAGLMNFLVPIAGDVLAPMFGFEPVYGVCLCRFIFGLCQGPLFPIQTAILSGWLHERERSTISALVGCCWALFQAFQAAVTPYFMEGWGWQYAFYTYSLFVAVWAYIWINFGVGIDPKLEPRCSPEEADYLVDKLDKGKEKPKPVLTLAVWLAVAKQPVVWGMALCTVIKGFGEPVFLT